MHFRRIGVGADEDQNRNDRTGVLVMRKRGNTEETGRGYQFDLENEKVESRVIPSCFLGWRVDGHCLL